MSESGAPKVRRPTMQDVAERVGMSRQLVSIVMRGAEGASTESRKKILAAAQDIGYQPDESAQILRRRRSGRIGVLYAMRQPFDVDLVDALYEVTEQLGLSLILSTLGPGRSHRTAVDELMRQRIEALLVITSGNPSGEVSDVPASIPTVLVGGPWSPTGSDRVAVDNETGLNLAIDHLTDLGHDSIAYVGPRVGPNAAERSAAYRSSVEARDLVADEIPGDFTETAGSAAADLLLARPSLPSAVICVNDRCAVGLLTTLLRAGVRVPEDISLVGFDDSSVAALPSFDLTSVRPNADTMAQLAVDAVLARIQKPDAETSVRLVHPTLAVRGSTARPHRQ